MIFRPRRVRRARGVSSSPMIWANPVSGSSGFESQKLSFMFDV